LENEDMDYNVIIEEEEEEGLSIQTMAKRAVLKNWTVLSPPSPWVAWQNL